MDVPVVFLDGGGEREMIIGDVEINPTLEYKPFQIMLSHKMKISPNQISVHLLHTKPYPQPTDNYDRRRIIGKANFGLICRHKERFFLVELKRYRRCKTFSGLAEYFSSERYLCTLPPRMRLMPESMVLIRSNHYCVELSDFYVKRYFSLPPRMRRRYHIQVPELADLDGECGADIAPANNGTSTSGKLIMFCEECERDGNTTSFHPCINDAVITCFTTKLGPIKRSIAV